MSAHSRGRRLLRAIGFGIACALPVAVLAFVVREKFLPVIEFDEAAIRAATDLTRDNPALRALWIGWQEATQPKWVNLAGTALCVIVWRRHGLKSRALWAFVTLMVAWNLQFVLKLVVQRARPIVSDPVSHAPGYSFPSGHATNAAAAAVILTLLVWPILSKQARRVVVVVAVVFVGVTGLDRIFLGVHFPSDVVAGLLLGAGIAGASYLGYVGWNPGDQLTSSSLRSGKNAP